MSLKIIRLSQGGKMRIFEAILQESKVFINNGTVEVPNAKILSEGVGDSEGILILSGAECVYIAQTTGDVKKALTILKDGFNKLASDVVQASGGTSDVGGATPTFRADMQQVANNLNKLIGGLK